MGPKKVQGSQKLAQAIKMRRNELNLTIEEAASKAGVGIKTWCRYEAGESIRKDKYSGVCKALNWRRFPEDELDDEHEMNISQFRKSDIWSVFLEKQFGEEAAASFVIGSDILLDDLDQDLRELAKMPRGAHIGQIVFSFLADEMPQQFLVRYDYDFMYAMRAKLEQLREMARHGSAFMAHSVLEELILYLIVEEARGLLDDSDLEVECGWDEWIYDIFDDDDIIMFLFSGQYLNKDDVYHFDNWMEQQFYCDN